MSPPQRQQQQQHCQQAAHSHLVTAAAPACSSGSAQHTRGLALPQRSLVIDWQQKQHTRVHTPQPSQCSD